MNASSEQHALHSSSITITIYLWCTSHTYLWCCSNHEKMLVNNDIIQLEQNHLDVIQSTWNYVRIKYQHYVNGVCVLCKSFQWLGLIRSCSFLFKLLQTLTHYVHYNMYDRSYQYKVPLWHNQMFCLIQIGKTVDEETFCLFIDHFVWCSMLWLHLTVCLVIGNADAEVNVMYYI